MKKINLHNLKTVIRKSTFDKIIEFAQLRFQNNRIISRMISGDKAAMSYLDLENDVIIFEDNPHEEITLNLGELDKFLYEISVIENHTGQSVVDFEIETVFEETNQMCFLPTYEYQGKVFTQRHTSCLIHDDVIRAYVLPGNNEIPDNYIGKLEIDENLEKILDLELSLSKRYGKFYCQIIDGFLYFNTTDLNNIYENNHLIPVLDSINSEDSTYCFNSENLSKMLNIIKIIERPLTMGIIQIPDNSYIQIFTEDKKENYFIFESHF